MKLPAPARDFLQGHDTMTLATVTPDGLPQAAAVFYAADDQPCLYYLSSPSSRHSQNVAGNSHAAATIQADGQSWREIRGLQLEGTVRQVSGPIETARSAAVYIARFDFLRGFADLLQHPTDRSVAAHLSGIQLALADSRFYIFCPTWVRMIDNVQGFGHKEEWDENDQ